MFFFLTVVVLILFIHNVVFCTFFFGIVVLFSLVCTLTSYQCPCHVELKGYILAYLLHTYIINY